MKENKVFKNLVLLAVGLGLFGSLAACSGNDAPDEYMVLKNPPLVVPPDYHLRPPGNEDSVKTYTPQEVAKKALFGEEQE